MLNAALDFSCGELSFAAVYPCGHAAASFQVDLPGRDSSSLPILVGNALTEAGFTYDDIDTWTVGTGPGSFTALRVASAFVLGASRGKNQTVRGIPSACGFEGETSFGDRVLVLYDGRKHELLGFGLKLDGCCWIPDGWQGVLDSPDKLNELRGSYDTFTASPHDIEAVRLFDPSLPVVLSPHVNAATLANIPPGICDMPPTELIYLRPAVFVDPKPIRTFPGA